jgi:hypothetical protein
MWRALNAALHIEHGDKSTGHLKVCQPDPKTAIWLRQAGCFLSGQAVEHPDNGYLRVAVIKQGITMEETNGTRIKR